MLEGSIDFKWRWTLSLSILPFIIYQSLGSDRIQGQSDTRRWWSAGRNIRHLPFIVGGKYNSAKFLICALLISVQYLSIYIRYELIYILQVAWKLWLTGNCSVVVGASWVMVAWLPYGCRMVVRWSQSICHMAIARLSVASFFLNNIPYLPTKRTYGTYAHVQDLALGVYCMFGMDGIENFSYHLKKNRPTYQWIAGMKMIIIDA